MTVYITDIPVRLQRRHGSGDVAGSVKNAILKLETDAGIAGWGDAAPWAVFTGTVEANAAALHVSGGQQQRVAIARAMAMAPELMLFDEVTSALDLELVGEVLDVMKQLDTDGPTMIVVTHEMAFANDVADHVAVMDAGQVVEQGAAVDVLLQSKNPRTAAFLSRFHSTIGDRKV